MLIFGQKKHTVFIDSMGFDQPVLMILNPYSNNKNIVQLLFFLFPCFMRF